MFDRLSQDQRQELNIVREGHNVFITGRVERVGRTIAFYQVFFQQGRVALGKWCICCYPISTILACLFSVGNRISWKKLCWKGARRRKWHLLSPTLYIIIEYRVNLNKLSRNFVRALRTATTNCRVSFIDLYLVWFPRNFRILLLPHTNTVILLERYCGTITEPGLPVFTRYKWAYDLMRRLLSADERLKWWKVLEIKVTSLGWIFIPFVSRLK